MVLLEENKFNVDFDKKKSIKFAGTKKTSIFALSKTKGA
jgi:hypothetical protein